MPRMKLPPNPYSQYGRRRMRREFWHRYHNECTPQQRAANERVNGYVMVIILMVAGALILLIGGPELLIALLQ